MGRYDIYEHRERRNPHQKSPWKIHPIWRGIGCLLMVIIPVVSYMGAVYLVRENAQQHWVPMPRQLVQSVLVPGVGVVPHLFASLLTAVVLALFIFGLLTIVYSILYTIFGPPRYGPYDAPPRSYPGPRRD